MNHRIRKEVAHATIRERDMDKYEIAFGYADATMILDGINHQFGTACKVPKFKRIWDYLNKRFDEMDTNP